MFDNNENRQQFLSNGSRESIELLTKIRKQFQLAVLEEQREQQVMTVIDLMENMQRGWRAASGENAQLREQNGRLKRQIENFETALAEARVENQRLNSQHAADEELIGALQLELDQYKERFSRARLEIQNAGLGIGMPSIDQSQKKVTPADEDTTEEDDDENVFLAQQPVNHGPKDGLPPFAAGGGGDRARRRRSNSVGVLSDKQPLDFLSPFPANPPKLVLGPLFVPSAAAANSANRMPTPKMSVQKSPPPQSKQMHQNHQLTPVSTRPRHRIPVRIGGTPPSRRKWGGGGRGENGEGNNGEQQYPPPSTEPRGKSFKYRLTPYSPASSIFCRQQQHRHNNNHHRMASPIPINFSNDSATLPPPPPLLSSKQQPKPMKTILTTMENGGPAALPPLMEPTNPTNAGGGGITLGPFLSNGDGQNAGQGEQQESSTEKQYLPSIRPKIPAQWKSTLGNLY